MRTEQRRDFSVEGIVEVGPQADFFMFLDGEQIGKLFSQHSGVETNPYETPGLGERGLRQNGWKMNEATQEVLRASNPA